MRQGANARELKNNIGARQLNSRKDAEHQIQKIIDLIISTTDLIGIIHWNIRSANDHTIKQREDEHDTSIFVLKKEFIFANGFAKFVVLHNNMRTLRASNETGGYAQFAICEIDPRTGSVDNQLWVYIIG